jgi:MOSC domain-containing protein YiiM
MSALPDGKVAAVSRNERYSFSKPKRDEIVLVAGLGVEGDAHAGVTVKHRFRVAADPTQPNLRQVHLIQDELFDELREEGFDVQPGQLGENVTTRGIDLLSLPRGTILHFGPPTAGTPTTAGTASAAGTAEGFDTAGGAVTAGRTVTPGGAVTAGETVTAEGTVTPDTAGTPAEPEADPADAEPDPADAVAAVVAAAQQATLTEPAANALAALISAAGRAGPPGGRATVVVTGLRNPCGQINDFRPGLLKHVIGKDPDGNLVRKGGVMAVVLHGGPIQPGDPVTVELPPPPHLSLEPV